MFIHFQRENPLFLWPFSIAMLNYQRVGNITILAMEHDHEIHRKRQKKMRRAGPQIHLDPPAGTRVWIAQT